MIKIPRDVHSHMCHFDIYTDGTGTMVSLPTNHWFPFYACKFV
jgi:hypothetical protein